MFSFLRALNHRSFALLWGGQSISNLGDSMYRVALLWWVLEQTGSATVLGTVLIFQTVPMLLFALLGGVLVDRFARLHLMIISDVVRGTLVCLMGVLAFTDTLAIWHLYIFVVIFGCVDAIFPSAYRAAVPELTPAEALPSANALTDLSVTIGGIVGPMFAAALVTLSGPSLALLFDGLSFFVSVICLLPLHTLSTKPQRETLASGILDDVQDGLKTVRGSAWLWVTIGVAGISNLTYAGPMSVALPFLISNHLHANVSTLGLFYSVQSVGAVIGAMWIGRQTHLRRRGVKMYGVWIVAGLMVMLMGLTPSIPLVLVASFIFGIANTLLGLIWLNSLQELVPQALQGRVSSIDYLGSSLLEPVGLALGGWATTLLGPALVFVIGGSAQSILIALGLLHSEVRNLD